MESLLHMDRNLFLYLNGMGTPLYDGFWLMMTHKATNAVVYLTTALWFGYRMGWRHFLRLFIIAILLVACTDQITNAFKYGFERLRPCHEPALEGLVRLVKARCGGLYSYFSGHASNSFALATFFFFMTKPMLNRGGWLFFILATLVAYSRVYIGVHYPLDILSGIVFGSAIGYGFSRLSRSYILR